MKFFHLLDLVRWTVSLVASLGLAHAAGPVVSNITAAQRSETKAVDIAYDVAADTPTVTVSLRISSDGSATFDLQATTLRGAIGAGRNLTVRDNTPVTAGDKRFIRVEEGKPALAP